MACWNSDEVGVAGVKKQKKKEIQQWVGKILRRDH